VFCRCRPLNKEETSAGCAAVVDFDGGKDGDIGIITSGPNKKAFKFDRVYTPKDDQGSFDRLIYILQRMLMGTILLLLT
jgi:kinesin family member C2/C3